MNHKEKARELFLNGYNCAQAVFVAFSDVTGLDERQALLVASSFGGGMGHIGEACGAVSGMFMAVGMIFGYTDTDAQTKKQHYSRVHELSERFKARFGALRCPELLSNLQKGEYELPAHDVYNKRPCLIFVERAAELVEEVLKEI